jgi:hypothetical protein
MSLWETEVNEILYEVKQNPLFVTSAGCQPNTTPALLFSWEIKKGGSSFRILAPFSGENEKNLVCTLVLSSSSVLICVWRYQTGCFLYDLKSSKIQCASSSIQPSCYRSSYKVSETHMDSLFFIPLIFFQHLLMSSVIYFCCRKPFPPLMFSRIMVRWTRRFDATPQIRTITTKKSRRTNSSCFFRGRARHPTRSQSKRWH